MTDPLGKQLDAYADEFPEAPAWDDVVRRAGAPRRRLAGLAAVVAAGILIPAALALPAIRHVFEGTPAPAPVVGAFRAGNRAAARLPAALVRRYGLRRVDPSTAHGVLEVSSLSGPLYLWAARQRGGAGQCWFVTWQDALRLGLALATDPGCDGAKRPLISYSYAWRVPHWATAVLVGRVSTDAASLTVTYGCGQRRTVPVVEGLFLTTFLYGTRVSTLTARDESGRVTAVRQVPWRPSPGAPPEPNRGERCPAAKTGPRVVSGATATHPGAVDAVALTYWPKANPPGRIAAAAKGIHLQARWRIPLAFVTEEGVLPARFPPSSQGQKCGRGVVLQVWFRGGEARRYGPCRLPAAVGNLDQKLLDELGYLMLQAGKTHAPG